MRDCLANVLTLNVQVICWKQRAASRLLRSRETNRRTERSVWSKNDRNVSRHSSECQKRRKVELLDRTSVQLDNIVEEAVFSQREQRDDMRDGIQLRLEVSISPNSSLEPLPLEADEVVEKTVDGFATNVDPENIGRSYTMTSPAQSRRSQSTDFG